MKKSRPKLTEFRTGRDHGVSSRNDRARLPETAVSPDRLAAGGLHTGVDGECPDVADTTEMGHAPAKTSATTPTSMTWAAFATAGAGDDHSADTRPGVSGMPGKPAMSAYGRALGLLGRREHSRRELKDKLVARGLDDDDIDAALVKLDDRGFQSDRRFAEMLARSRIAQGHGPIRILAELRLKGVDAGTAQDALDGQEADWLALATRLCQRRFRGRAVDHGERVKRAHFLARRGFPAAIARAAASADGGGADPADG